MTSPLVSVILISSVKRDTLSETIASVLSQSYRDLELLIIDVGKEADIPASSKHDDADRWDSRVSLVYNPKPGSTAEALNWGVKKSRGQWLVWLGEGELLAPSMIQECLSALNEHPTTSIVYSDRLEIKMERRVIQSGDFNIESLKYNDIIPSCAFFSRRAWADVGGFRLNVEAGEAWDFWIACASRGFIGRRIPFPLVHFSKEKSAARPETARGKEIQISQMRINNRECFSHEETQAAEQLLGQLALVGTKPSFHLAHIPMVSVVIPTYNRSDTLVIAIESVMTQTFRDFEIVVVSDCGSNDLEQLVKNFNKRQNITFVRHATNRGLGASRNTGIGATRGKYIAYLDDDDFFYPDHLETLVGYLEQSGEKVAYTDAHRIWQQKVNGKYVEFKRDVPYAHDFNYDVILIHNFIPVLCFVHARECVREVGVFDETLSTHEDWDLWIRMSRKYRMHHIQKLTSAFTTREDETNMSNRRKNNFFDTTIAIYDKHPEFVANRPELQKARADRLDQMRLEFGFAQKVEDPLSIISRHTQALMQFDAGDVLGAITTLSTLVSEVGGDARIHNDLAVALSKVGESGLAETHLRKAMELDANFAPASRNLGDLCFKQKRMQEALTFLTKAYELAPDEKATSLSIAKLSESLGQMDVALQFYRHVLDLDPINAHALEGIEVLENKGKG